MKINNRYDNSSVISTEKSEQKYTQEYFKNRLQLSIEKRDKLKYKSISPVDDNYVFGNIIEKRRAEQNPNHPNNHLKLIDEVMIHNTNKKDQKNLRKLNQGAAQQEQLQYSKKKYKSLSKGLGPAHMGSKEWSQKMDMYIKMKETAKQNHLLNQFLLKNKSKLKVIQSNPSSIARQVNVNKEIEF